MYHSRILKVMAYLLPPWEQEKGEKVAKHIEASNTIKTDCILYNTKAGDCNALKCLYCRVEKCGFYKSNAKYNLDGSRRQ